jgi:putative oxidoreductase
MLAAIFIASGAKALADAERLAARAKLVTDRVSPLLEKADSRLPTDARTLVQLNGVVQIAGGLLLATGHATRPAAAVLAGSLVPTTIAGHPFWLEDDPVQRRNQQLHFLKNLGLLGGLLLAAVDTQGKPGLRWRASHSMQHSVRAAKRTVRTAKRDAKLARRSAAVARRLPG